MIEPRFNHNTVNLHQPYGVRVERADGAEFTFNARYVTRAPLDDQPRLAVTIAQAECARVRSAHGYYGPVIVFIWALWPVAVRGGYDDDYRLPIPYATAERYEFPDQTELLRARERRTRLHLLADRH